MSFKINYKLNTVQSVFKLHKVNIIHYNSYHGMQKRLLISVYKFNCKYLCHQSVIMYFILLNIYKTNRGKFPEGNITSKPQATRVE